MKIGIAGDWHGNTQWACSMVEQASPMLDPDYKLIFQLGDFGYWPGVRGKAYLNELNETLEKEETDLFFIDGNHENHPLLRNKARKDGIDPDHATRPVLITNRILWLPRGSIMTVNGKRILAMGGAASVDREYRTEGVSWFPEERITDEQVAYAISKGPADIMLCHDRPSSAPVTFGPSSWPAVDLALSEVNRDKLQAIVNSAKPEIICHGHLHMFMHAEYDFGYGPVKVTGFDCDGTQNNWSILNTENMNWEG